MKTLSIVLGIALIIICFYEGFQHWGQDNMESFELFVIGGLLAKTIFYK